MCVLLLKIKKAMLENRVLSLFDRVDTSIHNVLILDFYLHDNAQISKSGILITIKRFAEIQNVTKTFA